MKRFLLGSVMAIGSFAVTTAMTSDLPPAGGVDAPAFHLELSKSAPEADAMLTESPSTITLWFTQVPQLAGTSVRLLPKGGEPLELGAVHAQADDGKVIILDVAPPLATGEYEVHWRAMAQDGHVVRGTFGFMVHAER